MSLPTGAQIPIEQRDPREITNSLGMRFALVPAGTPKAIVELLYAETINILKMPDVKERFAAIGVDVVGNTPDEFGAFIKAEMARWGKIIKEKGIRSE